MTESCEREDIIGQCNGGVHFGRFDLSPRLYTRFVWPTSVTRSCIAISIGCCDKALNLNFTGSDCGQLTLAYPVFMDHLLRSRAILVIPSPDCVIFLTFCFLCRIKQRSSPSTLKAFESFYVQRRYWVTFASQANLVLPWG